MKQRLPKNNIYNEFLGRKEALGTLLKHFVVCPSHYFSNEKVR